MKGDPGPPGGPVSILRALPEKFKLYRETCDRRPTSEQRPPAKQRPFTKYAILFDIVKYTSRQKLPLYKYAHGIIGSRCISMPMKPVIKRANNLVSHRLIQNIGYFGSLQAKCMQITLGHTSKTGSV